MNYSLIKLITPRDTGGLCGRGARQATELQLRDAECCSVDVRRLGGGACGGHRGHSAHPRYSAQSAHRRPAQPRRRVQRYPTAQHPAQEGPAAGQSCFNFCIYDFVFFLIHR